MLIGAVALAVLAVALAWPIPIALARAAWPVDNPATALVLWQAIALGGGLSMFGSLLGFGLAGTGANLPHAGADLRATAFTGPLPSDYGAIQLFLLSAAALLALDLLVNLVDTAVRAERERRRHRDLIALLTAPHADRARVRVIEHPAPVAYCLPGARTVTVLSNGLIELLDADRLRAVLAHEDAHLRQQHHLMLLAFRSWRRALPWFPIATRAERSVGLLVELLADDQAVRQADAETLAAAIEQVGSGWEAAEDATTSAAGRSVASAMAVRIRRLRVNGRPLTRAARLGVLAASVGLVAVPAGYLVALMI